MLLFETILVMLACAVALMAIARRLRMPYPVLLALAGMIVAIAPIGITIAVDPDLVLALFVAPVLLDAAYDTSLRDIRRNWGAVASMALLAVGLTAFAVAAVAHALLPQIPWAAAIAIGAIVAPPDAIAATAVMRDVKLPHRLAVVLEGEALLNDASSLLIYRLAVGAAVAGGSIGADAIAPAFLLSLVGSLVAGPALAWVWGGILARLTDVPSAIILQFVSTFGVWVVAEKLSLSPILTIVAYAMTLSRMPGAYQPARLRLPSYAVWQTAVSALNALAFLLIGIELAPVIAKARPGELGEWMVVAGAVLATVIVVRLVWTVTNACWHGWLIARETIAAPVDGAAPGWREGLLVGWAGSRGIVTVATALALPIGFPERDALLFTAFVVTLGTLLIQGLTLGPLVHALGLKDDEDPVQRDERAARAALADAALAGIAGRTGDAADRLRREIERERACALDARAGSGRLQPSDAGLRIDAIRRRRVRLMDMRNRGEIGEPAFQILEEELDRASLAIADEE